MRFVGIALSVLVISVYCVPFYQPTLSPVVQLYNGYTMPIVGLGTYSVTGAQCEQAVKDAIDLGYRHIDTAYLYGNEKEIGNAVRAKISDGTVRREDLFITTKLWNTFHEPSNVLLGFQKSFENLNVGYIDLFLMHSPEAYQTIPKAGASQQPQSVDDIELFPKDQNGQTLNANIDFVETYRAMEQLLSTGLIRSIGVSNFNAQQIERLEANTQIKPVTNQVECHPNKNERPLIDFCAARGIAVTAYSPLGRPHEANGKQIALFDPNVQLIAQRYNKTPAQIILRYTVQNGGLVIPKSTHKERIAENINIFDFQLDPQEMEYLNSLNRPQQPQQPPSQ